MILSTPLAEAEPWSIFWDLILQFEGTDVENEIQCPLMTATFSYQVFGNHSFLYNGKTPILVDLVIMCLLMELFSVGQKNGLLVWGTGRKGSILGKKQNIS